MEIRKTEMFAVWLDNLRDVRARARVQARIERLAQGNAGDVQPVGEGVSELRIHYGPGYRIYFKQRGRDLIILLAGGAKSTQDKNIALPCVSHWSSLKRRGSFRNYPLEIPTRQTAGDVELAKDKPFLGTACQTLSRLVCRFTTGCPDFF